MLTRLFPLQQNLYTGEKLKMLTLTWTRVAKSGTMGSSVSLQRLEDEQTRLYSRNKAISPRYLSLVSDPQVFYCHWYHRNLGPEPLPIFVIKLLKTSVLLSSSFNGNTVPSFKPKNLYMLKKYASWFNKHIIFFHLGTVPLSFPGIWGWNVLH